VTGNFSLYNGIHPGAILHRELTKRGIKPTELALAIQEHKQTISAILNERRGVNAKLSIKLSKYLNCEPAFFSYLQANYEIHQALKENQKQQETPNLSIIRKVIFWDTDFEKIDWIAKKSAVIKRVFERGNEQEIYEILRYYGKEIVLQVLLNYKNDFLPALQENISKYLTNEHNEII
jgi:addiction module HigA family antidote